MLIYYNFNKHFTEASLTLGYNQLDLIVDLRIVLLLKLWLACTYILAPDAQGRLPNVAWEMAYPDGVILETYRINVQGEQEDFSPSVIKPR